MSASGALLTAIAADNATGAGNSAIQAAANATLFQAIRTLYLSAQRKNAIDDVDVYNEMKRLANSVNTAQTIKHDWYK